MATWKPAPQAAGGLTPAVGKYVQGTAVGSPINQTPPPWKPMPSGSSLDTPAGAIGIPI